jgi:hypothetical protein
VGGGPACAHAGLRERGDDRRNTLGERTCDGMVKVWVVWDPLWEHVVAVRSTEELANRCISEWYETEGKVHDRQFEEIYNLTHDGFEVDGVVKYPEWSRK